MIVDSTAQQPQGAPFTALAESLFTFTLTGSQYFGYATPASDWDFIVQDSPLLRSWLAQAGFSRIVTKNYEHKGVPATNDVFERNTDGVRVQLQVCESAATKRWVRDYIMQQPRLLRAHALMNKHQRGALWRGLEAVVTMTPEWV